jgi:environmental stress-induced protein Ves
MARATLLRGAELTPMPWKDGGGVTREIAAHPAGSGLDTFTWRVSLADVAQPGPFSRFAGIDRTLVLLSGDGMHLHEDNGPTHQLNHPLDKLEFAGETAIHATLPGGATRDFNVMLRRGVANGSDQIWRAGTHELNGDTVLLFCAEGEMEVAWDDDIVRLATADTLRFDQADGLPCRISGNGVLLGVQIRSGVCPRM